VQQNADYVLKVPIRIEEGSLMILIISDDKNTLLASTNIIQPEIEFKTKEQPTLLVRVRLDEKAVDGFAVRCF